MFVNMKLSIIESSKYDGYSLHSCQRAACDLVGFGIQSVGRGLVNSYCCFSLTLLTQGRSLALWREEKPLPCGFLELLTITMSQRQQITELITVCRVDT